MLGITRRAVQQHINNLIKWGHLVAKGRRRVGGGWSANDYILLFAPVQKAAADALKEGSVQSATDDPNSPRKAVLASKSDAKASFAYPLGGGRDQPEDDGGMRSLVSHRGEAEFRDPCEAKFRNNNIPSDHPIEQPFANASARGGEARFVEELGVQQGSARVKISEMRPSPPRDPLDELIRRIACSTQVPEGQLWVDALGCCDTLQKAGFTHSEARALVVDVGKDHLGHGNVIRDLITVIVNRLQDSIVARNDKGRPK